MARRPALLAVTLLACALAARHTPSWQISDSSQSDSLYPFELWEEYAETVEYSPTPYPPTSPKQSAKVILRAKGSKTNPTVQSTQTENKKHITKTTTINFHSHTNFIVTERPPGAILEPLNVTSVPVTETAYKVSTLQTVPYRPRPHSAPATTGPARVSTTARPRRATPRVTSPRPPVSSPRPRVTSPRPRVSSPRSRRPATEPPSTPRPKQTTLKNKSTKKAVCIKHSGYISSFFEGTKLKRATKKRKKTGFLTNVFDWILDPKISWFPGGSWFQDSSKNEPTTTTTPIPPLTTTESSWFQTILGSEDINTPSADVDDDAKKPETAGLKKNYKGYQLIRAYSDAPWKLHEMLDLQEESQGSGITWWTAPSMNTSTDFLVPPDLMDDVRDHLKSSKIQYDVVIRDLQNAIKYENPRLSKKQRLELEKSRGHPMTWRRYHRYADILRYLEYLQHSYANIVELVPLGRSTEGLPLVAVKISIPQNETQAKGTRNKVKRWKLRSRMKPAVWIDGGAHAREWIAPAVVTWMMHALVEGELGLGPDYEMLKQADFYMMPVLNPDGYEHSHTHDRLWSKTRSRQPDHSDDYFVGWFPWNWGRTECVGVDTDRNWDYRWAEFDSSDDPCAENYAGPQPFSEPETRAVADFITGQRGQIKVYMSLHAYSQAWLLPSSHAEATFGDEGQLVEMGKLATAAVADVLGTKYKVGTVSEIYQPASGMSHDWASKMGIKYPYHISLPDTIGQYGYLLPGSQIVSTARETWQGVKAIVDNLNPE